MAGIVVDLPIKFVAADGADLPSLPPTLDDIAKFRGGMNGNKGGDERRKKATWACAPFCSTSISNPSCSVKGFLSV
jgi:hypothetical protein